MKNLIYYFKVLFRNKILTVINILGLTIGISTCICIGLYITEQLSYDQYNKNINRIFSVTLKWETSGQVNHLATTTVALGPELKHDYPEVEKVVRLKNIANPTVRYERNIFKEKDLFETDKEIFDVFSYEVLEGNLQKSLEGHNSIVVTKSFAKKYFGSASPMNKLLTIDDKTYQVTAVIKDVPPTSDIKFSALIPIDNLLQTAWFEDVEYYTFILFSEKYLKRDPHATSFLSKLKKLADENINRKFASKEEGRVDFLLQPLKSQHFRDRLMLDTPKTSMKYLSIIAGVAVLVLIIGSLNFINFCLIQSLDRNKEVAVRKLAGASFYQLAVRHLIESILLALIAFVLALIAVSLLLPYLRAVTGMDFGSKNLWRFGFLLIALGGVILEGILAGAYPAFYLSSINLNDALKGRVSGPSGNKFRNVSMVVQFSIAMGLIICTLLASKQMGYLSTYDVGFNKDNIIVLSTPADTAHAKELRIFKNSLLQNESIKTVSNLNYGSLPGEGGSVGQAGLKGSDKLEVVTFCRVDEDYLPILNIHLKEGRNFDKTRLQDSVDAVIINEVFQKDWGITDPLTETVLWGGREYRIIGVTKNFNLASLHNVIEPLLIFCDQKTVTNTLVAFKQGVPVSRQFSLLQEEWQRMFPNEPFQYRFLDETLGEQYSSDERFVRLFILFSSLSIVVALLGLLGLCSLTMSQRRREIAIRKIIGANILSMIFLFFRKYLQLIVLSFLIISPFSLMVMRKWLNGFPFRTKIDFSIFIVTLASTISIAVLIVSVATVRTFDTNPTKVVKS